MPTDIRFWRIQNNCTGGTLKSAETVAARGLQADKGAVWGITARNTNK
jgi:hypothetical protein